MRAWNARSIARMALQRTGATIRASRDAGTLRLEVHHPRLPGAPSEPPPVSPLLHDAMAALRRVHGGKPAAFACPLAQCVDSNGLSFGPGGWHPFVAALREYAAGEATRYEESTLRRYYEHWRPDNLAEALIGTAGLDEPALRATPSYVVNLLPWSAKSAAEARATVEHNLYRDYVEHGRPDLTLANDGCQFHGPNSAAAGRLQFARLIQAYEQLEQHGYLREHGDARVVPVRRRGQMRFIVLDGLHRTAAVQALGHRTIPATFTQAPAIFDAADAAEWPQVARGLWSRSAAESYVDHLFDFDALAWAQRLGNDLVTGGPRGRTEVS